MSVETVLCALQKDCSSLPYPIHESAFLAPAAIPFSAEVRRACEANLCGRFGKCWTCPPGVGRWEDLRDHYHRYAHAFVFTTVHPLEDSYDIEGMTEGREQHTRTERAIEKLLFAESEPFVVCGAGDAPYARNARTHHAAIRSLYATPWRESESMSSHSRQTAGSTTTTVCIP